MNATRMFCPRARSPNWVAGPSAITSPAWTISPSLTNAFWLIEVFWLERWYLTSLWTSTPDSSSLKLSRWITIRLESTKITLPSWPANKIAPESRATVDSTPVPTRGASVLTTGTACLIMFEPIKALLASSCSRNGISDVAIEIIWDGETSIKSTSVASTKASSPCLRAAIKLPDTLPSLINCLSAWAIIFPSSSNEEKYLIFFSNERSSLTTL